MVYLEIADVMQQQSLCCNVALRHLLRYHLHQEPIPSTGPGCEQDASLHLVHWVPCNLNVIAVWAYNAEFNTTRREMKNGMVSPMGPWFKCVPFC
mmetsp:Transcript_39167/g.90439  ORF Transcript_39167/g.90439 Transcript_39167/m.90439 type:complete len:95 (-) Transcript_39167:249-533(-)